MLKFSFENTHKLFEKCLEKNKHEKVSTTKIVKFPQKKNGIIKFLIEKTFLFLVYSESEEDLLEDERFFLEAFFFVDFSLAESDSVFSSIHFSFLERLLDLLEKGF